MWWKEPTIKTHFEVVKGDILHITPHMFNKKYFQTLKNNIFDFSILFGTIVFLYRITCQSICVSFFFFFGQFQR